MGAEPQRSMRSDASASPGKSSGSMRANFRLLEEAAEAFVRRLRPADKARIGSFAWRVDVDPEEFTSDQSRLLRIVRMDLQNSGDGPTPLWNAVNVAIYKIAIYTTLGDTGAALRHATGIEVRLLLKPERRS